MSDTMPGTDRVEIRTLKVGRFCVVDDEAYKILSISKSKPGKHGSAKAMITGKDIFTDKQYEETFGTGDNSCLSAIGPLNMNWRQF